MHFVLYDLCVKFECALCTRPSQAEGAEQLGFSNEGKAAPSDTPRPPLFLAKARTLVFIWLNDFQLGLPINLPTVIIDAIQYLYNIRFV